MNIIAQHYQQKRLIDIDSLTFHHQERDLSLLYGTKAIAKVNHFFQENLALKQAFLALEKEDELKFFNLLKQAQLRDLELLEHHHVSSPSENKIANTIKWLQNTFPQVSFRLHGFGFQADFILLIPNDSFRDMFKRLKKQFYQDHVKEIRIVNQGIRIFKS
jgi:galactokinase